MIITESNSPQIVTERDPDQPDAQEELLKSLTQYVVLQISNGHSNQEVINMLTEKGMDKSISGKIVPQIRVQLAQAAVDDANKNMLHGALWCIGGTVITVLTFSAASGGGRYFVCYGAIIFGGIQFFRGLFKISGAKEQLANAGGETVDADAQEVKYLE